MEAKIFISVFITILLFLDNFGLTCGLNNIKPINNTDNRKSSSRNTKT